MSMHLVLCLNLCFFTQTLTCTLPLPIQVGPYCASNFPTHIITRVDEINYINVHVVNISAMFSPHETVVGIIPKHLSMTEITVIASNPAGDVNISELHSELIFGAYSVCSHVWYVTQCVCVCVCVCVYVHMCYPIDSTKIQLCI